MSQQENGNDYICARHKPITLVAEILVCAECSSEYSTHREEPLVNWELGRCVVLKIDVVFTENSLAD